MKERLIGQAFHRAPKLWCLNVVMLTLLALFYLRPVASAGLSNLGWLCFAGEELSSAAGVMPSQAGELASVCMEFPGLFRVATSLTRNSSAYLGLGQVLSRDGALAPAIQRVQDAVETGRIDPVTYLFLGNLAEQAGNEALALHAWRSGRAERYFETRARFAGSTGNDEAALSLNLRAIEINPKTDQAYLGVGQYYFGKGLFARAVEAFATRARLYEDRQGYSWLGRAAEASGDVDGARRAYEKAAELGELWYGYVALGDVYYRQGDLAMAREWYQRGLVAFPGSISVYLKLGVVALRQGELTVAGAYFREALKSAPENPSAAYHMGVWYNTQRDYESARMWFEQAMSRGLQADYSFYEVLLDSYQHVGDCNAAQEAYERAQRNTSLSDEQRTALLRRLAICTGGGAGMNRWLLSPAQAGH